MGNGNIRRITIPVPNPALAQMLKGPRAAVECERISGTIAAVYQASLPVRTGNLKAGVYHYIGLGGWGEGEHDRWFGYVGNRALSYRKTKGQPYAGTMEYGNSRMRGRHQLAHAAQAVLGSHAHVATRARNYNGGEGIRTYGDRNPQTGLTQFRNRKGQFTRSPRKQG